MGIEKGKQRCGDMYVKIKDAEENSFVDKFDVERLIRNGYGEILNVSADSIDRNRIEQVLTNNSAIKSAQVYVGLDGSFHVDITQRRPILRVVSGEKSYYIDEDGSIMPLSRKYTARVVVAVGKISDRFATSVLYPFVVSLKEDELWNSYVEQIVVNSEDDIRLVPKVGNFTILMGGLENSGNKLDKLRLFLKKGTEQKGWNTYKEINLKFEKQIVCVRK
ncbi:MAG: cell division protein FtsQ [Culturomica sp.]|nr:cell division protein FtsQ [Culturomica sp.]